MDVIGDIKPKSIFSQVSRIPFFKDIPVLRSTFDLMA
jgi:type II secretory pathway component GspD/PulD (secretin)